MNRGDIIMNILNQIRPYSMDRFYHDLSYVCSLYTDAALSKDSMVYPDGSRVEGVKVELKISYAGTPVFIVKVAVFFPCWYPAWYPSLTIKLPSNGQYTYTPEYQKTNGAIDLPIFHRWSEQCTIQQFVQELQTCFHTSPLLITGSSPHIQQSWGTSSNTYPPYPVVNQSIPDTSAQLNKLKNDIKGQLVSTYKNFVATSNQEMNEIQSFNNIKDDTQLIQDGIQELDKQIAICEIAQQKYQDELNHLCSLINKPSSNLTPEEYLHSKDVLSEQMIDCLSRISTYNAHIKFIYESKSLDIDMKLKLLDPIAKTKFEYMELSNLIWSTQAQSQYH